MKKSELRKFIYNAKRRWKRTWEFRCVSRVSPFHRNEQECPACDVARRILSSVNNRPFCPIDLCELCPIDYGYLPYDPRHCCNFASRYSMWLKNDLDFADASSVLKETKWLSVEKYLQKLANREVIISFEGEV